MNPNVGRLGPLPLRRRAAAVVALGALLAVMLAACGTSESDVSGGSVTATPSDSASASATVGEQLAGEVGYFRSGGIAGFMDQLMVSPDGVAVLQRRGKEVVRCKVKPAPLSQLAQLQAATVKSVPSPSAAPRKMPPSADMMTVGLVVGGTRVPSSLLASTPAQWRTLFDQMSTLFEDAVALSPGSTSTPNPAASMCDPI